MKNVTNGESKAQEKPFPKLMKHNDSKLQVFFRKPKEGIVVVPNKFYALNDVKYTWDMGNFTELK